MKIIDTIMRHLKKLPALVKHHPSWTFILFGVLVSLIAFLPHIGIMRFGTMSTVYAYIIILTTVALGLNLLLGFSGLISLGTAGFVGAGALGTAVFLNMGFPLEIAVLAVLFISGLIGAVIGLFSLKVESIYLAIATLFVGEIMRQIYTNVPIFGGQELNLGDDSRNFVTFFGVWELSFFDQMHRSILFVIITAAMVLSMIIIHHIIKSRTGRALMAMSRSQHAAQAMGVSLIKYRVMAFVIATLFATFGGVLYGIYYQSVPTEQWNLDLSLFLIAMIVVGGLKSIYGTVLGVFIIHGVPNLWLKNWFGDVSYVFSGVLIIAVIIFYPRGFIHIGHDLRRAYAGLRTRMRKKVKHHGEN